MPVTTHQFIDQFLAKPNHKRAILGTIHPPQIDNFWIPFFYGNQGSFWHRFREAFPHLNFDNLYAIIQTLSKYDIWMNDMVRECTHIDGLATDNKLSGISLNTRQIEYGLRNSQIDEIFFTSEFTFTLFKKAFGMRLPFDRQSRETVIPANHFGRSIRAVILYSPSKNANVGIAGSKAYKTWSKERVTNDLVNSVNDFRNEHYRNKMTFWNLP